MDFKVSGFDWDEGNRALFNVQASASA